MTYMLLILEPHGQRAARSADEGQAAYAQMQAFAAELRAEGVLQATSSLRPDAQGVRVQVREGRHRAVDGPFIESKEMIGGYFLVDCASLDAAVTLATRCPAAAWSTVEVRELGPCFLK
jgi:hypothetical protein